MTSRSKYGLAYRQRKTKKGLCIEGGCWANAKKPRGLRCAKCADKENARRKRLAFKNLSIKGTTLSVKVSPKEMKEILDSLGSTVDDYPQCKQDAADLVSDILSQNV